MAAPGPWTERRLALLWLAGAGLLLVVLGVWGVALGGAERLALALEGRWQARLDRGEALYAAGRFEDAALYLERLDRDHPAVFVKHRLDRQRERVLELLARSQLELGRKRRAEKAARRAVDFDPRNWRNHRLEAEVALHFGELEDADEALEEVLELYPSHLQSVIDRVRLAYEAGRYAEVTPLFAAYLDAWRPASMRLEAGGHRAALELRVDGRPQAVEALLEEAEDASGEVTLDTAGYAVRVERVELLGTAEVGRPGPAPAVALPVDAGARLPAPDGGPLALGPAPDFAPARARLVLTAYKALPPELWTMAERSYSNTLDHDGLAAARARVLVGAPEAPLQYTD